MASEPVTGIKSESLTTFIGISTLSEMRGSFAEFTLSQMKKILSLRSG